MHACGARGHWLFFSLLLTVLTAEHQGQTELNRKAFIHQEMLFSRPAGTDGADHLWKTISIKLSNALLVVAISMHALDFFYVLVPSVHHG